MKTIIILFFFMFLLLNQPTCAIAQSENDSLQAFVVVSDKPDEENLNRKTVREFVVGEMVYFAFAASGMKRNSKSEVSIYATVALINPEGETVFSETKFAPTKTFLPSNVKALYLSQSFDVGFDHNDPLGMYTLKLTVTDTYSGQSASTQTTILLFSTALAKQLVMSRVTSTKHLDDLWALYFKTKNPWAVKRIIACIPFKASQDFEKSLIGEAAIWSLESNARQYPDVYDICKDNLRVTKGRMKELLSGIVAAVDSSKER